MLCTLNNLHLTLCSSTLDFARNLHFFAIYKDKLIAQNSRVADNHLAQETTWFIENFVFFFKSKMIIEWVPINVPVCNK